jgi:hypothetical protein
MIWPAIFRHESFLPGCGAGGGAGFDGAVPEGGGGIGAFIGMSIFEKNQPNSDCEENQHAGINQRFWTYVGLYPGTDKQQPDDECDSKANDDTRYPCRKIRAQNVHAR